MNYREMTDDELYEYITAHYGKNWELEAIMDNKELFMEFWARITSGKD